MFSKPEINSSSGKTMKGFRSLTLRYIFLGLTIITLIGIFTAISFLFTSHIDNDAKRVNIAGRERMVSFKIAWLLNKAVREKGEEQAKTLNDLKNETLPLFEKNLYILRDGSTEYDLRPLPKRKDLTSHINILIQKWQSEVKPLLSMAISDIEKGEFASIREYNITVRSYVNEIDIFVNSLVMDYESKLRFYGKLRISVLALSTLVFIALGLLVRKSLVMPIIRLRDAAEQIEKGNFDVMLEVKSRDEIGILTKSFNQMARSLHMFFDEKIRHLKEVMALADSSNTLNSLPMREDIYETVCNVAVRNFGLKMAWIGIIDEKTYDLNPVAHAGFEDSYLSNVRFIWEDLPDNIPPSCIALRSKLPEIIQDIDAFPVNTTWKIEAVKRGYRSSLSIPLISSEDKVIGSLNLYGGEIGFFTEDRVKLFHTFANQVAVAIENRWHIERCEEDFRVIKIAHKELKELHQNYESLVNSIDGIVWEADARTFQFSFVSRKAEKILGYPVEKWLDNPMFCKEHIHPDDREWVISSCINATSEKRDHEVEYRAVALDGRIVWLRNIVTVVVEDDQPVKLRGVMVDVTERKKIEEALKEYSEKLTEQLSLVSRSKKEWEDTFDNITDMISIHDRDFNVIRCNMAFAEYFGLHPREVVNKKCYELFHKSDSPVVNCPHEKTLKEKRPTTVEILGPRGDRVFRISTYPHYSPEGELLGSIHIARDITETKEKEMRLIASERLSTLGHMAAGIAHEINNPLASIAGCAEGLLAKVKKGQYDPQLCEKYLKIIEEEILRCRDITNSMLSFVRKTTYEKKEIDINNTLDKSLEIVGFQGRLREIDVIRDYKEDLPSIYGSEGELRQVFLSIIINALDAMEDKGKLILETGVIPPAETLKEKGAGELIYINISDTGPGIPQEHINRIFDTFFTTKSEKGGAGLGLSIARKIVANHNGNIEVSSEVGKGTIFKITLPV